MDYKQKYEQWLNRANLDGELLAELTAINGNETAIEDAFYKDLSFGTGGLRGVIGAGTNKMNIYTVAKASMGLARYLLESFENPSCAVAYDSRNKSDIFAEISAATLAGMGVDVYIYKELMPTPMLSYAVRKLRCDGGIVITASHNPAKYNGYKVYGNDGCQITLEAAQKISGYIKKEGDFSDEEFDFSSLMSCGKIKYIDDAVIEDYYSDVMSLSVQKPQVPLNIVYSPLNGAGNKPVRAILQKLGNINVEIVKEQENPNGDFTTCPYPNPEIQEAMQLASDCASASGADLFLATDPDCDRVGIGLIADGEVKLISGNETGILLLQYLCEQRTNNGTMPKKPVAVKTIVTTQMAYALAKKYNLELKNVLTGFKFIGEQIALLEQNNETERFIFGFEESYGYLSGSFVRDKDAVIASMLICEMAAYYKAQGLNLLEVLAKAYSDYGYYKQDLLTFEFDGAKGMDKMNEIIDGVRLLKGKTFADKDIVEMIDYENDETGLPKSNVLSLTLSDECFVIIRPSGTEPKLKLYVTAVGQNSATADGKLQLLCKKCGDYIKAN